jgi:phosphoribosylanthranilate isomerase
MSTLIKICGITNLEDALAAVDAGADMLGFNFYRPSPRYIEPHAARAIINNLPERILTAGVFVNEKLEEVKRIPASCCCKCTATKRRNTVRVCVRVSFR